MIDTHIHFWKLERGDYGWLSPSNELLYRDYMPDQLEQLLAANGVEGIIVVQAASTVEETEFLLQLAKQHRFIKGVVGWLDVKSEHFRQQYDRVRSDPHFVGIRINGAAIHNTDTESFKSVATNVKMLADDRLSLDVLIQPRDLPSLLRLLPEIGDAKVVINHVGVPLAKGQANEPWHHCMRQIAEYPHTMCKISGMVTFVERLQTEPFKPYVDALLEYFGAKRLMFGTDWPVALQGGSYDQTVRYFREVVPERLSDADWNDICVNNAKRFYLDQTGLFAAQDAK